MALIGSKTGAASPALAHLLVHRRWMQEGGRLAGRSRPSTASSMPIPAHVLMVTSRMKVRLHKYTAIPSKNLLLLGNDEESDRALACFREAPDDRRSVFRLN